MPAAGYRLADDNPLRFTLAGCLENRDAGVDLAQAGSAAISRPSASSFRSQAAWASKAARSAPLMVAMKVIPWRTHEKDPLVQAPILSLLRVLGMPQRRLREGHRTHRQSERSQSRLVPGVGEPPGGMGQNPCKGRKPEATASPRRCPERPFARAAGLSLVGVDVSTLGGSARGLLLAGRSGSAFRVRRGCAASRRRERPRLPTWPQW